MRSFNSIVSSQTYIESWCLP